MKPARLLLAALAVAGFSTPLLAESVDFNLTYHVERTPGARLSIETCGEVTAQAAAQAGLSAKVSSYPGQLVTVSGGKTGAGAFVVQCITVDETTVSVVQGVDYRPAKGALGGFADQAFAAIKAAAK